VGPAPNVVPEGKNCSTQSVVLTPAPVTLAGTPAALGASELAKNVTSEPPMRDPDGVPVIVTPACGDFAPLMTKKVPTSPIVPVYLKHVVAVLPQSDRVESAPTSVTVAVRVKSSLAQFPWFPESGCAVNLVDALTVVAALAVPGRARPATDAPTTAIPAIATLVRTDS